MCEEKERWFNCYKFRKFLWNVVVPIIILILVIWVLFSALRWLNYTDNQEHIEQLKAMKECMQKTNNDIDFCWKVYQESR